MTLNFIRFGMSHREKYHKFHMHQLLGLLLFNNRRGHFTVTIEMAKLVNNLLIKKAIR
jgi:hypothetical protein